ncbi:hypothetical protein BKA70DRAFT_1296339 [Coprinopsis sp. MPI-PUGE-AT-0042]|nr:hypothetical protein BKA70DRAFT_1296339 [Coprinopsis sp. MPI-PUGE-AT-0042]
MLSQSSKLEEASTSILQSSEKPHSTRSSQSDKPHKRSDSSENDDQSHKMIFKGRLSSSPSSGRHSRAQRHKPKSQIPPVLWISAVPSISKYLRTRHSQSLAKRTNAATKNQPNSGRVPLGESPCSNINGFDFGGQERDMEMDVDRNGIQIPSLPSIAISTMVHMHHRARRDGGTKPRTPSGDQCHWREIKREEDRESSPHGDDAMKE